MGPRAAPNPGAATRPWELSWELSEERSRWGPLAP